MNWTAIIAPRRTRVTPAAPVLMSPRWTMDPRNGATATVISTATPPDTEKKTDAVRMTLARPSWSLSAVILATRWTTAVDTPTSSRAR